jgi:Sensors of blue-light using FAD
MPYQVIYSSESATPMQTDDLEDILESARESNAEAGITGALIYVDGFFLQILEGGAKPVRELMARICKDVRHEAVTVLKEGDVATAVFADWRMAYVSATARQVAEWAGLSGTTTVPDILADMHRSPSRITQVAERILAVLSDGADARPGAR